MEAHHLYSRKRGCPDDLTVWLCSSCHGRAHQMTHRVDVGALTRAGLSSAKARGVKLGNRTNLAEAQAKGAATNRATFDAFAASVSPTILEIQAAGVTSLRAIARALNDRSVRTARGGPWNGRMVRSILRRAP